ncbi:putative acyltransferase [Bernardetia litoralis DSM 6794]|uniref:Putative acyltransferase n=1 Tax=Bernardetia litoralis (strain ATCC 23117 / DSM 6794 / NBRC 15988 / NCIMB 1366 / Fx l1 / Sio-4) TaxID=880071 RepID=I4AK87_BERLS|nr:acyltransferase [Bernardetia litoralis]AFM04372.1 putative acyltransferase [Bernardetia litoralis DSM 6794]
MNQKNKRIPALDGMRAISILLVIGAHLKHSDLFSSLLPSYIYFDGTLGVGVFFTISGFLITTLMLKEENSKGKINLKNFYIRRFLRLMPVYYAFLIVLVIIDYFTIVDITWCQYLSSLTYTKNFFCGSWIDGHLWSLAVEEQFYLVWPLIFYFVPKKYRIKIAVALVIVAPIFRLYFYFTKQGNLLVFSFFSNMDCLMIGCLVAYIYFKEYKIIDLLNKLPQGLVRFVALGLIFFSSLIQYLLLFGFFTVPFNKTVQSIAVGILIVSYSLQPKGWSYNFLNLKFITYIGVLSYSIYLWQQPLLVPSGFYGKENPIITTFPYSVFVIAIVSILSYELLEKYFFKLKKKFK